MTVRTIPILIQCYIRGKAELTLFILDSSISSKLLFLNISLIKDIRELKMRQICDTDRPRLKNSR